MPDTSGPQFKIVAICSGNTSFFDNGAQALRPAGHFKIYFANPVPSNGKTQLSSCTYLVGSIPDHVEPRSRDLEFDMCDKLL